jgi:iron complex outermembrane receptor protein
MIRSLSGDKRHFKYLTKSFLKGFASLFLYILFVPDLRAQSDTVLVRDSIKASLDEVIIHAYENNRNKMLVPMPVAVIEERALNNFVAQSAVQVINTIPGVRMDERSPASYRLNIRGSSMRAPFGVRNVKVYYNDLPYTEPGGTSYINQLGLLNFAGAEIVKGPGSSMYGAGTGGVVLLGTLRPDHTGINAGYVYGSYNTHTFYADAHIVSEKTMQRIMYQQSLSDGYRDQSASNRKIFNWDATYKLSERLQLSHKFLYGDLYYQTPGALTFKEFSNNPNDARPASGSFPSAVEAQVAIWQKTAMSGISLKADMGKGFSNKTGIYVAYTSLDNAAIRNFSNVMQPHSGGRSVFSFLKDINTFTLKADAGAEFQHGLSSIDVYDNNSGKPGALQSISDIRTTQWFLFLQASLTWQGWELLLGSSLNNINLKYNSDYPALITGTTRSFSNILLPRISISKAVHTNAFVYASLSKGFSPPVTDELLPSGSVFNPQLQPEKGINYELGIRYRLPNKLWIELNGYYFRLNQAIVQRRDAAGGDYYVNAGNTIQPGIEISAVWQGGIKEVLSWQCNVGYAFQPYHYGDFVREQNDFSGNALPGLSKHNLYMGIHIELLKHFIFHANYYYNSRVPLNDLNSEFGNEVHSLSGRVGYQFKKEQYAFLLSAGMDNILDQRYSLGYDINAAAGRYYNAAPGRNYFIQVVLRK